jgi:hypothetical protein
MFERGNFGGGIMVVDGSLTKVGQAFYETAAIDHRRAASQAKAPALGHNTSGPWL